MKFVVPDDIRNDARNILSPNQYDSAGPLFLRGADAKPDFGKNSWRIYEERSTRRQKRINSSSHTHSTNTSYFFVYLRLFKPVDLGALFSEYDL